MPKGPAGPFFILTGNGKSPKRRKPASSERLAGSQAQTPDRVNVSVLLAREKATSILHCKILWYWFTEHGATVFSSPSTLASE